MKRLLNPGDLWKWPMEPIMAAQVVRVRVVHGATSIIDKFQELHVCAEIVRQVVYLCIEHHMQDLIHLRHCVFAFRY